MKLATLAWLASATFAARTLWLAARSTEQLSRLRPSGALPSLSIVVPARDEERQIERCVRSLLAQRHADFEVVVVDDGSEDRTLEILQRIAADEPRLKVVSGAPLPDGWIGKPWALRQGAEHARGEWLLFTDADTIHEPDGAASALGYALLHEARVVSLLPTQLFESPSERVLLPAILWMIAFAVGSLDAINDPRRTDAAIFNGQYLLFERGAYDALGGHASVREKVAEDYEFARLVKRDGRFRSRLAGANDLVYTRMYRSAAEIWNGFSKNLFVAAIDRPGQAVAGTVMLAALAPLPVVLLFRAVVRRRYRAAVSMAASILLAAGAAEAAMRRSRFPAGSGAFFHMGATFMLATFVNSALAHRTGRVFWRGRRYAGR